MIDVALASIVINIISNYLYDTSKCVFGSLHDNRKRMDKKFKKAVEKWLSSDDLLIMEGLIKSESFREYLSSAQVRDIIRGYAGYMITGTILDDIEDKTVFRGMASSNVDQEFISNYLASQSPFAGDDLTKEFFILLLDFVNNFFATKLTIEQKALIYLVNSNNSRIANSMNAKLDQLCDMLKSMTSRSILAERSDFQVSKEKYHGILKEKYSRAHIYLLDSFSFGKFYVRPHLCRNSDSSRRGNSIDIDALVVEGKVDERRLFKDQADFRAVFGESSYTKQGYEDWKYIFDYSNLIYITGGAGYGKSLFLKNIVINVNELNIPMSEKYLVIYCDLKTFYDPISEKQKSIIEFIQDSMISDTGMSRSELSSDFIDYYLNQGKCIVLLDALDEVSKEKRNNLHDTIVAYFKKSNPNNKICITSRDRGFVPRESIDWYSITPLDLKQIELYVDKIISLGKFSKEDKEPFLQQSRVLVGKGFLSSFLILSLLINIYKAELELPENKLELYEKCFEYIASKREKEKTQSQFNWARISPLMKDNTFIELSSLGFPNNQDVGKNRIIEHLSDMYCFKYDNRADAEDAIGEFLAFCSDRTELFVPSPVEDHFKFFHRSFLNTSTHSTFFIDVSLLKMFSIG